jgi:site-specific DNA-methyltransferase (adenine-specific)
MNKSMLTKEKIENQYIIGDCKNILADVEDDTFDLIITSPPYADQRKNTYGGIHPDSYVDWFLPGSKQSSGNIKRTRNSNKKNRQKLVISL